LRAYKSSPIAGLQPYEANARTHSEEQVEQIAASIREFGFTNPVLVDEHGGILAGHGRVLAAALLGWSEVPTLELSGLTDTQKRALVLADNKLALNAGWDIGLLRAEMQGLIDDGFDASLVGFSPEELADLFTVEVAGLTDADDAPPLQAVATSVLGDVWVLGPHRLCVGDATLQEAYDQLLGTERVDICWTDPPYNVNYEAGAGKIANDHQSDADFLQFLRDAFVGVFQAIKPGGAVYCAHADTERANFTNAFLAAGLKLSGVIIWKKDALVLGRSDYQWIHEPILYGWRPGSRHRWYGGRKNTSVVDLGTSSPFTQLPDGRWQVVVGGQFMVVAGDAVVEQLVPSLIEEPRPKRSTEHPTMKPVALIERMLKHNARAGDLVLDPFGGSGSTLIAADRLGMSSRLIELDPCYADVIVRRWQAHSGRQAVHAVDGRPFGD
jgi:DNA modification methylase